MCIRDRHYVFPSKDQMLRAVIARLIEDVVDALRAEPELEHGVEYALRHGVRSFWGKLVESEIGLQVMQYELAMYSVRTEGPGGLAQLQYDRYVALVAEFCERAAQVAHERCAVDFQTLGRLSLALVDGLIIQYVSSPDLDRAHRDLDRAVDMIVQFADPQPITHRGRRTP